MFKGLIQLKNGTSVQVECDTVAEFTSLLSSMNGENPASFKKARAPWGSKKAARPDIIDELTTGPKRRKKYRKQQPWSERDLNLAAKIVRDNIDASGISSMVITHLRKIGDNRDRSRNTVYSMVTDMKHYIKGEPHRITSGTVATLSKLGFNPSRRSFFGSEIRSPKEA